MSDAPLRVFLSYARIDSSSFVDTLEADLKKHHLQPWVDRHRLEGGAEWLEMIQEAIDQCQALVVILSPAAVQSKYVRMEYRYAASTGKLVIPVLYLPVPRIPIDLHLLQWVDFQAGYEEGLASLIQALSHLKPLRETTPAPQKTKQQWVNEVNMHYQAGHIERALIVCERTILLNPSDADLYTTKGFILNSLLRFEEALVACEHAIHLDPGRANAYANLGYTLNRLMRLEEGLAACERAIQLDHSHAAAYNNKGWALYQLKRYEEAVEAYEQAIRLNPDEPDYHVNQGNALKSLGRAVEAEQAFKKTQELGF